MWLLLIVILVSPAWSCDKGCFEYKDTCACEIPPETAQPVKPSNEKPPSDKMPSYQREGIKVLNLPSTMNEDEKLDKERDEALAEGRKTAGEVK